MENRRPLKVRVRMQRTPRRGINFPQLRQEVSLVNRVGLLLNQSDPYRQFNIGRNNDLWFVNGGAHQQ